MSSTAEVSKGTRRGRWCSRSAASSAAKIERHGSSQGERSNQDGCGERCEECNPDQPGPGPPEWRTAQDSGPRDRTHGRWRTVATITVPIMTEVAASRSQAKGANV